MTSTGVGAAVVSSQRSSTSGVNTLATGTVRSAMRSDSPASPPLLAMNQESAARNRPARCDPARQFRAVGMAGVVVDAADTRGDLDFIALDAHRLGAVIEETAERALRLKADEQHRRIAVPQPALEMVADSAGIAHTAG